MSKQPQYSLAICFPVWNRPDLFRASIASLLRQLTGVEASIWIFDNGSDAPTRELIEDLSSTQPRLFKVFLPQNMGIPFVVNIFSQIVTQDCQHAGYRAPTHVMLADADAYFKKPVRDMLEILESHSHFAVISGHDSIEHESVTQLTQTFRGEATTVKVKSIERGLCLIMRKEILAACVPFPHHRDKDVDWELMKWHPNSVSARTRQLAVVDYVAHLGLYDSTWDPVGAPANPAEIAEINQILEKEGLLSPERRARMEDYGHHSVFTSACGPGTTERAIEIPWVLSRYKGEKRVLEVGCSFATENRQYIEGLLKLAIPQLHGIDISSVPAPDFIKRTADIRESGYEADFFDLIFCVSTLEHVGRDNSRHYKPVAELPVRVIDKTAPDVRAMTEMLRILKPGGRLLVTVPFGRFVDYGWFINYDAAAIERVLVSSQIGAIQAEYFRYTPEGWMPCSADELAHTAYGDNDAPAAAGVACFEITKQSDE